MIPVVSVSQMREIDSDAIDGSLTSGYSYMLKAGLGLFNAAKDMLGVNLNGEIAIICGKGNNGGDGYVTGRMLLDTGYRVMCFSLCDTDELRGESKIAFDEYCNRKGNFLVLNDIADLADLSRYSLIIDAILGTGMRGDPHGLCGSVIDLINSSGVQVLAADTPSGLNNDTGIPSIPCIRASVTVTIGFPKIGLYFHPGKEYVGRLIIQDIGYPDEIVAQKKVIVSFPTFKHMEKLLPARHAGGSKYDHGLALLVCGSRGYTGSAALACEASLRTGCGMVHLAIPESIVPVLSIKLTETVLHSLKETKNGTLDVSAVDQVKDLVNGKNALCIGPGLTHEDQVALFVKEIIRTVKLPVILDADGINVFKGCAEELMDHAGEMVITPHRGEWFRLFGELPSEPVAIIDTLRNVAFQYNLTILLKGSPSIVVTSKGIAYILPFGNSSLAKAGTGDVLSGIIVSLLAQGMSVENAAVLGCFIHGEAGVAASELLSEYSVVATDVVNNIYKVMKRLWGRETD